MRTLKKCKWEDIEVGEVYAVEGCWCIIYKYSETQSMPLATTFRRNQYGEYFGFNWDYLGDLSSDLIWKSGITHPLYKLPLSVQRLWRCD